MFDEMIIDNFAGGGGASTGIEAAVGRPIDVAINHDLEAIAMHEANHPLTKHYCESVWDVDPLEVTQGRPVGLAWFSPDCKHFSKAKGGKPVEKKIRGLAWVAIRWASLVKPRIIILENVEEFITWGPLGPDGRPCPKRKGKTFRAFVRALERKGYVVEWRELVAADYGAPTTRKRLFLIARCDGQPIVWPAPTHNKKGTNGLKKWIPAADIIDWSLPMQSIFERERPLKEKTLRRIARGIFKYVINAEKPFIVTTNHQGENFRGMDVDEPFKTITASRDDHQLVVPTLIQRGWGERKGQAPRVPGVENPVGAICAQGIKHAIACAHLLKMNGEKGGNFVYGRDPGTEPIATITGTDTNRIITANLIRHQGESIGSDIEDPAGTVMASGGGKTGITFCNLIKLRGTSSAASCDEPAPTITSGGTHLAVARVEAFLLKYYGQGIGQSAEDPAATLTTKDRLAIVTINSIDYVIVDISMRMLNEEELFRAQGFPDDYIIHPMVVNKRGELKPLTKTAAVRMVGNSVCPPLAEALVRANYQELKATKRKRA